MFGRALGGVSATPVDSVYVLDAFGFIVVGYLRRQRGDALTDGLLAQENFELRGSHRSLS